VHYPSPKIGLVWFNHDLRLDDNAAVLNAASDCEQLIYLYCLDPALELPVYFQCRRLGPHRKRFLNESLRDLDKSLKKTGGRLTILKKPALIAISDLIEDYGVSVVYCHRSGSVEEQSTLRELNRSFPKLDIQVHEGFTLFDEAALPFPLAWLPPSFTPFRKQVEALDITPPLDAPQSLPSSPSQLPFTPIREPDAPPQEVPEFIGGERAAQRHLHRYFSGNAASDYKNTRNSFDTWAHSTKLSPWLAHGNLSARRIIQALNDYEHRVGKNESTYWIYFELLWREYFQWYARKHGARLFHFRGLKQSTPNTSFYAERFCKWREGTTPWPIVNACMRQLKHTGYLSNRGRQLVASCLVNELQLDWRYGAAYFEEQLIDFDVASNWGNWQYLAGVGADPRGQRHFDLEKQQQRYDPTGTFTRTWAGESPCAALDSLDAAGWPRSG